jgi:hypothetical protein
MLRALPVELKEKLSLNVSLTSGSHWAWTTAGVTRSRGTREKEVRSEM